MTAHKTGHKIAHKNLRPAFRVGDVVRALADCSWRFGRRRR
jgi:hypothetical protein